MTSTEFITHTRRWKPSTTLPALNPRASESQAQWPSRRGSSAVPLHSPLHRVASAAAVIYSPSSYFTHREKPERACPAQAFVDHSCFPAQASASVLTRQDAVVSQATGTPWEVQGFCFYNSKVVRCGESQWNKQKSHTCPDQYLNVWKVCDFICSPINYSVFFCFKLSLKKIFFKRK